MPQRDARLQVPIDQAVLDKMQILADRLGFDSVPALVRFWAKAETNKLGEKPYGGDPNAVVLKYVELILALEPGKPASVSSALDYLIYQLKQPNFKKLLFTLPNQATSDKIFDT